MIAAPPVPSRRPVVLLPLTLVLLAPLDGAQGAIPVLAGCWRRVVDNGLRRGVQLANLRSAAIAWAVRQGCAGRYDHPRGHGVSWR